MSDVEDEIPNQTTLDAIREMDDDIKNPNLKTYDSFDELLTDLDGEADSPLDDKKRYNPADFPYPLNESMEEVYTLHDQGDTEHLFSAVQNLFYDIKDLYTFKGAPLAQVKEMQSYFLGFLEEKRN